MGVPTLFGQPVRQGQQQSIEYKMAILYPHINPIILVLMILVVTCLSTDDTTTTPRPPLSCYECGGTDNACNTKEDLGKAVECPAVSEVCSVAIEGDKVHRKCGREGEVEAKCVDDGGFCTCKGDLCNTGSRIIGSAVIVILSVVSFINL